MKTARVESTEPLAALKEQYMRQTTAPLDGMWLTGFVPLADHYGLYRSEELVGYYCVNEDDFLLQFFVSPGHRHRAAAGFEALLQDGNSEIKGAFASTAEPQYLSLCLDNFSAFEVNALMYQREGQPLGSGEEKGALPMDAITSSQLADVVAFAVENVGAPEAWLTGYYENLIGRGELFGVWEDRRLIATGENRGYDQYQTDCADLGVVVAASERGKGIATRVLRQLAASNDERGLRSICSTERSNLAAQKAITRAGFFAHNRIIQFRS